MKLNTILSVFTPKDQKFIPLLKELVAVISQSALLLNELFSATDREERYRLSRLIKEEEQEGDKLSAKMLNELNRTFITPFDREDVNELADKLEDIIDSINRVSLKVMLYMPIDFVPAMIELTKVIQNGIKEIKVSMTALESIQKSDGDYKRHYEKIKYLEEEADAIYEKGILDLLKEEKDPVELMKSKEIIQELENTVNVINSTGKVFKTIFIKYA